ncbi:MAG: DUF3014 domain-containing protein [Rhodanobacter sp.]
MSKQTTTTSWIVTVVVIVAVVAAGVYLVRRAMHADTLPTTAATLSNDSAPGSTATTEQPIQHPIGLAQAGPASASTAALPALVDSDADVAAALSALVGGDSLRGVLVPKRIIARMVATVDALPRHGGVSAFIAPAHPPKTAVMTTTVVGETAMSAENAARYAPYMTLLENTDPQALVTWYVHAYPLFQKAYQQLGYPHGYFNDRLLVAIDDLLAAPEQVHPAALQITKGYYRYVDPALESLSAGQKLLLRVGPANEAKIKAKLRDLRGKLIGQMPPSARVKQGGAG